MKLAATQSLTMAGAIEMNSHPMEAKSYPVSIGSRTKLGSSTNDADLPSPKRVFVGPKKENICAVLVTYHPDARFAERLNKIREQVSATVIVDNTPDPTLVSSLQHLSSTEIEIIQNHENLGIGTALNQGFARA